MTDLRAVEVVTSWGDELLDVVYVPPSRARRFSVGTTRGAHVTTEVRAVAPVESVEGDAPTDWWFWSVLAASTAFHGVFILFVALMPRGPSVDGSSLRALPLEYLGRVADRVEEPMPRAQRSPTPDGRNGGTGVAHSLRAGAMGTPSAAPSTHRYAIMHTHDAPVALAREADRSDVRATGALGGLRAAIGNWETPTSPFGRDSAIGNDNESALGSLMGDVAGRSGGASGLGMVGVGRGGGGTGDGWIGLGDIGKLGHGAGPGGGNGFGFGGAASGLTGRSSRGVGALRICGRGGCGRDELAIGGLSRAVIQRVIAGHRAEVSYCYEQELARRPDLAGRVVVSFVIGPSGAVQSAALRSTDLSSPSVESCVVNAVRRWSFPAPVGGRIVVVDYPFVFQSS